MEGYDEKIASLVMEAVRKTNGDPELSGDLVETLARMLGGAVAILSDGTPECIDDLLTGATQYAFEVATSQGALVREVVNLRNTARPQ